MYSGLFFVVAVVVGSGAQKESVTGDVQEKMRVVVGASSAAAVAAAAALPWHWPLSTVPHNIINDDDRLLCYLLVSGLQLSSSSASQRDLSFMCTSGNSWDDIFL